MPRRWSSSKTLKVEKVVAGSSDAVINVRAQKAGRYEFFSTNTTRRPRRPRGRDKGRCACRLIIVFREVFEAGLIVGIVLAVTRSVPHRNQWIGGGVLAGVLAPCVVAMFASALSNLFAEWGRSCSTR